MCPLFVSFKESIFLQTGSIYVIFASICHLCQGSKHGKPKRKTWTLLKHSYDLTQNVNIIAIAFFSKKNNYSHEYEVRSCELEPETLDM